MTLSLSLPPLPHCCHWHCCVLSLLQAKLAAEGSAPLHVPALAKDVVITKAMATFTA